MRLLLLADVAKVGRKGALVEVADGYGQYLVRAGKARPVGVHEAAALIRTQEQQQRNAADRLRHRYEKVRECLHSTTPLVLTVPMNKEGHTYQQVRAEAIARLIAETCGVTLTPESIEIPTPIRRSGTHRIRISIRPFEPFEVEVHVNPSP